jgi:hypothetical protein
MRVVPRLTTVRQINDESLIAKKTRASVADRSGGDIRR